MSFFNKLFKKGQKDEIAWFAGEDSEMQKAISLAQKNFSYFKEQLKLEARRIIPAFQECLIKYAFPAEKQGVVVEHMFLSDIKFDGKKVIGIVASDPMYTDKVSEGDQVSIDPTRVSDWLFVMEDKAYGGYTFKHMLKCFSEKEKDMYRYQPPFVWIELD